MKKLPLFFYPCTLVVVSRDPSFLNILAYFSSQKNVALPAHSSAEAVQLLVYYKSYSINHSLFSMFTCDKHNEILYRVQSCVDITALEEMADNPEKHQEISIVITDLELSEIVAIEFARACTRFPIGKIMMIELSEKNNLLLKQNNGSLNRFIIKNHKKMNIILLRYIHELTVAYFHEMSAPLLLYLESDGLLPLSDPVFIQFFNEYCIKNNVNEYYLIEKMGSFLCIDKYAHRFYFILQTDRSIEHWLSVNNLANNFLIEDVKKRKRIPFFGVKKESRDILVAEWQEHGYKAHLLEGREKYYWSDTKSIYNIEEKPTLFFELLE